MSQITIRNLDDLIIERLKSQASHNGRSLEAEVRRILTQATKPTLSEAREIVQRFRKERYGDRILPDSSELVREDREP